MSELLPCPVEGCDHPPFKTPQARQNHIRNIHPEFLEGGNMNLKLDRVGPSWTGLDGLDYTVSCNITMKSSRELRFGYI